MTDTGRIQRAHGGGGLLSAELIEELILPALGSSQDARNLTDAAVLGFSPSSRLAFTTDTFVVRPLEFPGGDIGRLAVCGTVNDLAVVGATPLALSFALVLQEGLELTLLRRVLESAGRTASEIGVAIVTGDTKVVGREACDGILINTAGVGEVPGSLKLGFDCVRPGDRIILTGPLGEHGLSVLSCREGLSFATDLRSDCAAICGLTRCLVEKIGAELRFMRDPTRGGLAGTLAELARGTGRQIEIEEEAIPINPKAQAAAEILGLDLLTIANEGKLVAVVSEAASSQAVQLLSRQSIASRSAVIGAMGEPAAQSRVILRTATGGRRVVQMPYGEDLPRIC